MAQRALDILIVIDLGFDPPQDHDYSAYLDLPDWESEKDLLRTLKRMGHAPRFFGVYRNLADLVRELQTRRPDLVFNLCEAYGFEREYEPHVAAVFDMLDVPYTGCGALGLRLCKDKAMTKKILAYHGVGVPDFAVSPRANPLKSFASIRFPAIVKPLGLEASEGISQESLVRSEEACLKRVRWLHRRLKCDAIVEEYIEGREITVGVLGNGKPEVLPPQEVFFGKGDEGGPRFASFKAKWDEEYRKRWGIEAGGADPLTDEVESRIRAACLTVHQGFHLKGYARVDFRVREDGEVFFLEANPNPSIARGDEFARGARQGGYTYGRLIQKVIKLGLK